MKSPFLLLGLLAGLAQAAPGDLTHYGSFQKMMHLGDTSAKVNLSALGQEPGTWGLGALAGLKGEIIQVDGRILVTPGSDPKGLVRSAEKEDAATLWMGAKVGKWQTFPITTEMDAEAFTTFLREQAAKQGLDMSKPFLFRVSGEFAHLIWHVVTGERPAAAGHGQHALAHAPAIANSQSAMQVFRNPRAIGQLVGLHSSESLTGVLTHLGERAHVHFVDQEQKRSGHVDQYRVLAGATLWLPVP